MNKDYFYQNHKCPYYPCHKLNSPELEQEFSCFPFCFCPLYSLGTKCGGDFVILPNGIKDCSNCLKPHVDYDWVIERLKHEA